MDGRGLIEVAATTVTILILGMGTVAAVQFMLFPVSIPTSGRKAKLTLP